MANIKSAKKRISTIERRTAENKYVKATISTQIKKFRKMLAEGNIAEAEKFSKEVYSYIDSACSKGVIHRNNASRKIGRLAEALYKAQSTAKVETKKKEKVEEVKEVKAEETKAEPAKKATRTTRTTRTTKTTKTAKTTEEKPATKKSTKTTAKKDEEKPAKKTTTRTKKAE